MSVMKRLLETKPRRQYNKGFIGANVNAVELTGDKELDAYFKQLPTSVAKGGMRKATRQVAKFVREIAIGMAPEDTGALIASLKVRAAPRRKHKPWLVSTSVRVGGGLFTGDTFYGGFLELGTVDRQHKSGKSTGRIDRSRWAFLVPALFAYRESKMNMFAAELTLWVREQIWGAKK
jgi:HK97 gp10 family phage protein